MVSKDATPRLSILLSGIGEKTQIKCPFLYFTSNFTWMNLDKPAFFFVEMYSSVQMNLLRKIKDTIRFQKAKHRKIPFHWNAQMHDDANRCTKDIHKYKKKCAKYKKEKDLHSCKDVHRWVWIVDIWSKRRNLFFHFQIILQTSHKAHFS